MRGKFVKVRIADLKHRPIREDHGTDEQLRELAQSWLKRPIHPIVVRPDLTIAEGNRRVKGLELIGQTEVIVFVTEEDLTDADLLEISLTTDIHRAGVSTLDKCKAVIRLQEMNKLSGKELAERLNIDPSMITKYLSLKNCCPEVREALRSGTIGITTCYEVSGEPPERQRELLALKLTGMSRDGLKEHVRNEKNNDRPQVRAKRISCPLPSGISVVATGVGLTLDDFIKALSEIQVEAKKGRDKGMDPTTFSSVMKDRAKKEMSATNGSPD